MSNRRLLLGCGFVCLGFTLAPAALGVYLLRDLGRWRGDVSHAADLAEVVTFREASRMLAKVTRGVPLPEDVFDISIASLHGLDVAVCLVCHADEEELRALAAAYAKSQGASLRPLNPTNARDAKLIRLIFGTRKKSTLCKVLPEWADASEERDIVFFATAGNVPSIAIDRDEGRLYLSYP